ncbi:MAG: universal stress protein [Propionibacteriaceae bacterium]
MSSREQPRYVVVGVTPGQPDAVLLHAARFARHFNATLVCANVDLMSYVVSENADGSIEALQIDPDLPDVSPNVFDGGLAAHVHQALRNEGVDVSFRELAGDAAHALGRLAETLDAEMIVVGSRRSGFRSSVREYLGGSVAVHLAHRQHRCVVVVPVAPVPAGEQLPWEGPELT